MFSRWRLHRRIFHQSFRQTATPTYHPTLLRNAHIMLFNFLQDPSNYTNHFQMLVHSSSYLILKLIFVRFPSSYILSIIYDYEPKPKGDHIVHAMHRYVELAMAGVGLGATMIMETFPFRMFTHTQYRPVVKY